jgi:fused signal recognition particle receptor
MKFFKSLVQKFIGRPVDWDELEEMLIRSDLGVPMSLRIVEALQKRALTQTITAQDVVGVAREEILNVLPIQPALIRPLPAKPKAILIVGVNGTGKTTSTAKLAYYFRQNRHSVLLAAADTFRAAAIEQLAIWAERLKIEMVRGQYNADPAALCYEAYQSADRRDIEFLICDTAVKRSLAKHDPQAPHERLLVVDATTGSNALTQAREFHAAVDLTGLIVTKLDGSGKGGVVIAIQHELGIPTRFVGTGEKLEDLAPFDTRTFIEQML